MNRGLIAEFFNGLTRKISIGIVMLLMLPCSACSDDPNLSNDCTVTGLG